ncbi:CocE/NonD family hydrolase [Bradyrhizobium sp. CW1]|uniref:CocE/NonD family hydrolase n=1 Tax=Bradyrhizobium sp. CW1 TaxID=2782686 RepID=UPI0020005760|nr:CocE/NonD family hydrolase [Bradyrhizobium sp. CW1]UPJ26338.1 CocE/NonD family hydrolase [Bradyrhizobium sp. CW1]
MQRAKDHSVYDLRWVHNILIPLNDGVQLAASLCLPTAPGKYPAVASFYPYRKDDRTGASHAHASSYFTERGYVSLLVDLRGTGGSEGVADFDYEREGRDAAQVVEWAAGQDWCDGSVGVWGISYGATLSLAAAAQQPPHLKAIAPMYGVSGRRKDFAPGGCKICIGNASWLAMMLALDLAPPTFQDHEGRWMRVWRERLDRLKRDGARNFHKRYGDVDEKPVEVTPIPTERIKVPTFAIGGWRDFYPQAMVDLYRDVGGRRKLLMGPWLHQFPDLSVRAPVDFLHELQRFFDHWLKGEENGVPSEPEVTLYVQGAERWKHEREWPIARTQMQDWHLQPGHALGVAPTQSGSGDLYRSDPTVGTAATLPDMIQMGVGYPLEQAYDDLRSLTYTSAPLDQGIEITGSPEAILHVALEDGEELQLVAKLNAVAPDGRSTLITTGWLSAANRESLERAQPVERGAMAEYRLELWATSYFVAAGHRLRLAIACSDFPFIWPLRTNPTLRVQLRGSLVRLPVVSETAKPIDGLALPIPDPTVRRRPWHAPGEPPIWKIERDAVTGAVSVEIGSTSELRTATGTTFRFQQFVRANTSAARPDAAAAHCEARLDIRLPAGERIEVRTRSRFTRETTVMNGEVMLDGCPMFKGEWH